MVKLVTARESRQYGPRRVANRWEYINAALYVFAAVLMVAGLASQFARDGGAMTGLLLLLVALFIITAVNLHDLIAHMAGLEYRLSLIRFDPQLALVEFAAPLVESFGSVLIFLALISLLVQEERRSGFQARRHPLNLLIAGPLLWVIGSVLDSCQFYERADGRVQILQKCVQIPFLMGSLLFLVGGVINNYAQAGSLHRGLTLLGNCWIWLGIPGGVLLLIGGLSNVVKVFRTQQTDGVRLEKLRGGAQERLNRVREGQTPLIVENQRRKSQTDNTVSRTAGPTPYKDVLVSGP